MSAQDSMQQQLAAGGLVPASAKLGKADVVDTVVARAYRHAVLPGRTVVRLVAEGVTAGDDLEMATLGFGAGEDRGPVAKERKRALGFPGWALVHDPKNARYALDVVKELKKVARRVKSKPGAAKDGFDAIATKLGKTVPHFLPSFYEEAGRIFLEHGAASFAATYFGKAREAEAVHALEVDEQHRVDAFLEFALAGAVTTKALSQYAKELGEHHAPAEAYAHFKKLAVQRTLGGMPPWAGMGKDLQRLAKAAKLDVAAEDRAVIAEIIASPAIVSASGEFWRIYHEAIRDVAKREPAVRAALLNMFPKGSTYSAEADLAWLDLLEETGAMTALVDGDPEVKPAGGRAAWFDRLVQHLGRNWQKHTQPPRAFEILRRLAPKLVADGVPIHGIGHHTMADLDLCELALELGVPVAVRRDDKRAWMMTRFNLGEWARDASDPEHGRDPVRVAAHPDLGPVLVTAVEGSLGTEPFDTASAGKAGFLAAKRTWLAAQLDEIERGGLVDAVEILARIEQKVKASLFADLPELHARFAALDVAPVLARSLHIGIVDELGWPALEAVIAELSPDGKTTVMIHGGPPAIVCATRAKLVAVGAAGRLGEFDLVLPPKMELHAARFIGGRFLVLLREGTSGLRAYWSHAPQELFSDPELYVHHVTPLAQRATVTEDGTWVEGRTRIRAGDRVIPGSADLRAFDGTTTWVFDHADHGKWRELSAAGELGRQSWPRALEDALEDGWKMDGAASYLLPLAAGSAPVGLAAMFRTVSAESPLVSHRRLVQIGGAGATWTGASAKASTGVLLVPGSSEPRVLSEYAAWREGIQTTIWDSTHAARGSIVAWKDRDYSRGQAAPLSPIFWQHYAVRDEAGSRRLRAVTTADARALMTAIPVGEGGQIAESVPDEPIAKVLPEVTSQPLRNGITGFAIVAVKAEQLRDRLARERSPGAAAQRVDQPFPDVTINSAVENFVDRVWNKDGATWRQIAAVGAWFASEDRSNRHVATLGVPDTQLDWLAFAATPSVLAWAALAIATPAEHRRPLVALFAHLVRSLPIGDKLRVYHLDGAHGFPESPPGLHARWHGGNAYLVRKRSYNELYRIVEYAPDGAFKPPPWGRVYDEQRGTGSPLPAEAATELIAAIEAGTTSWSAAAAERIATVTGLSSSAAVYLWAGMPKIHDRGQNFLDKELREQLGLKAAQAALGRDAVNAVRDLRRLAAIEVAARAGVSAMLDGSAADVLAAAWNRHVGKRVAVSEELIADADSALSVTGQPAQWLAMFAAPDESPQLTTDGLFAFDVGGDVIRVGKAEPLVGQSKIAEAPLAFDASVIVAAVQYLPFLYAELPVGDELRTAAARAHAQILERLANPHLWIEGGVHYVTGDDATAFQRMLDGLGGEELAGLSSDLRGIRIPGAAVFQSKARATLRIHPASLDAKAAPLVDKLATAMSQYGRAAYTALQYVRSPGLAQMMQRIRDTPLAPGQWEQNPMLSVPRLVDKAAKKLGVGKDAAVLYLQYLTLLWPTSKNLIAWNGWKPKQLADAQAELVANDLLVEAKRERAQRGHFLPGGWEALKSPHPPMESWKVALYGVRNASGAPEPPNSRFLALAPFHAMFEAAWGRIEDNDIPRYDEVKR